MAPDQSARAQRLAHLWQRLVQAMNRHQTAARHGFVLLQKRLDHQDPKRRLEQQSQRLDELSARLQQLLAQAGIFSRHGFDRLRAAKLLGGLGGALAALLWRL
ncbi:hypothetical protein ACW4FQ_29910, partial [Escherichia coli]